MNDAPNVALLFMADGTIRRGLAKRLTTLGYEMEYATPGDLPDHSAWYTRVASLPGLTLLVHGVLPPQTKIADTSFVHFEKAFEESIGSLWIGGTVCSLAMRAHAGGAILVLVPPADGASILTMFGDGLRSLASCFGVGYANSEQPVRVVSVAVTLQGPEDPAIAELVAFLASDGASYVTATSIAIMGGKPLHGRKASS